MKETDEEAVEWLKHPKLDAMMAYHQLNEELQRKHMGQWVIIHGQEQVGGGYDSSSSAYDAARQMGLDPFACLILRVVKRRATILACAG